MTRLFSAAPVYTASTVSKLLPKVSTDTSPDDGVVNAYQTVWAIAVDRLSQTRYVGSPASLLALSVFAERMADAPSVVTALAAPKLSFTGAPRPRWTIRLPLALE